MSPHQDVPISSAAGDNLALGGSAPASSQTLNIQPNSANSVNSAKKRVSTRKKIKTKILNVLEDDNPDHAYWQRRKRKPKGSFDSAERDKNSKNLKKIKKKLDPNGPLSENTSPQDNNTGEQAWARDPLFNALNSSTNADKVKNAKKRNKSQPAMSGNNGTDDISMTGVPTLVNQTTTSSSMNDSVFNISSTYGVNSANIYKSSMNEQPVFEPMNKENMPIYDDEDGTLSGENDENEEENDQNTKNGNPQNPQLSKSTSLKKNNSFGNMVAEFRRRRPRPYKNRNFMSDKEEEQVRKSFPGFWDFYTAKSASTACRRTGYVELFIYFIKNLVAFLLLCVLLLNPITQKETTNACPNLFFLQCLAFIALISLAAMWVKGMKRFDEFMLYPSDFSRNIHLHWYLRRVSFDLCMYANCLIILLETLPESKSANGKKSKGGNSKTSSAQAGPNNIANVASARQSFYGGYDYSESLFGGADHGHVHNQHQHQHHTEQNITNNTFMNDERQRLWQRLVILVWYLVCLLIQCRVQIRGKLLCQLYQKEHTRNRNKIHEWDKQENKENKEAHLKAIERDYAARMDNEIFNSVPINSQNFTNPMTFETSINGALIPHTESAKLRAIRNSALSSYSANTIDQDQVEQDEELKDLLAQDEYTKAAIISGAMKMRPVQNKKSNNDEFADLEEDEEEIDLAEIYAQIGGTGTMGNSFGNGLNFNRSNTNNSYNSSSSNILLPTAGQSTSAPRKSLRMPMTNHSAIVKDKKKKEKKSKRSKDEQQRVQAAL